MSHFADPKWNAVTGMVAAATGAPAQPAHVDPTTTAGGQSLGGVDAGTPTAFTNSATPATLVAFVVPRAGLYFISGYLRVTAAGTGASQACAMTVAYNDGAAESAQAIFGQRGGASAPSASSTVDALTLNAALSVSTAIFAAAGSTITLALVGSGTITTAATVQSYWVIEAA